MPLPIKKLILLPLLWLGLFIIAAGILHREYAGKNLPHWIAEKRSQAKDDADIKLLNMLIPPKNYSEALLKANRGETLEAPPDDLVKYYEQLNKVMPWMAEGYAVLGYCSYRRGLKEEAFGKFQKACMLDPEFFWACQNFAIMNLEARQYAAAEQIFEMILSRDPRHTLSILAGSKVYRDLLELETAYNPAQSLQKAWENDAKMLSMLKNKKAIQSDQIGLQIRMF